MFDPEKILHKINSRENQSAYTDIPIFSLEDSPSSSQLAQVQGPDTTARILEYSPDNLYLENKKFKDEAESIDTSSSFMHPTPEAEEVK